jgi:ABC-type multidrug transport system ATPase subunit
LNDPVITAQELTRRFDGFTAVDGVSFEVGKAAIFGLLGPNGSGKSTIIRMLCGVLPPSAGTATVLGIDISKDPEGIKRHIGYMSQNFSLYGDLTVDENLEFYGRIYGLSNARRAERRNRVVELTGVGPYAGRLAAELSGGWKQRLALACALIHEPAVLFLDEPTAGIDPVARRELWDLLFELSGHGITMFVTTHYMDEAERCTHVGYIYLSKLVVLGEPRDLKTSQRVTPPGSVRYAVNCARPAQTLSRARHMDGVLDATLFGDMLHVLVEDRITPEALIKTVAPDDPEAKAHPTHATLEDVFVLLSRAESNVRGRGK